MDLSVRIIWLLFMQLLFVNPNDCFDNSVVAIDGVLELVEVDNQS